ncbi:MAG: LysR family transcriptional regulator [Methylotenera sp.]|nr:LysR family transcriptional regulator [Oligoflexia bacterium]
MEILHLEILRALVADPNLTRAAERLHMSQSALSKRVSAIEEEVGAPLFERRGPKGLKPLPQAFMLAQVADRVLNTWESGLQRIKRAADEPEHFHLVGPPLFLREVVLPWWHKSAKQFPDVQLQVQVSSLANVSLETIKAGADAGILEHKEDLNDYVCKPLYTEKWGIVRHPSVQHSDLRKYHWGTYSSHSNPVDNWLVQRQKMPPPSYHFYWEDLTAVALWVSETPGAASVLPWHSVVWLARRDKIVFEPLGADATTQLFLAYPKGSPHKHLIRELCTISAETEHTS